MKLNLRVYRENVWDFGNIERPGEAWLLRHCYSVGDPVLYLA